MIAPAQLQTQPSPHTALTDIRPGPAIALRHTLFEAYKCWMKLHEISKIGHRRFCIAPMMEWTDRHCRFFHRLLTHRALLYTEMLTTGAVLHGDRARLLRFDAAE